MGNVIKSEKFELEGTKEKYTVKFILTDDNLKMFEILFNKNSKVDENYLLNKLKDSKGYKLALKWAQGNIDFSKANVVDFTSYKLKKEMKSI